VKVEDPLDWMIAAIGQFGGTFGSPLVFALIVAVVAWLQRAAPSRSAGAAIGAAVGLVDALGTGAPLTEAASVAAAALAGLLQAEIALVLILPVGRRLWHLPYRLRQRHGKRSRSDSL
jgi:hypothetical protein